MTEQTPNSQFHASRLRCGVLEAFVDRGAGGFALTSLVGLPYHAALFSMGRSAHGS